MEVTNVVDNVHVEVTGSSSSEVFAYASKLVQSDLAAAVRIFRNQSNDQSAKREPTMEVAPV